MVVNAPQSNIVSAAEHTMALLLAQARNVPQAHAALKAGPVGALAVGGRRARRQDARHRRARPHRQARGPAGPGLRHAPDRLRPLRQRRPGPPDGRRAAAARAGRGRGRLPHHPPAPDQGDDRPGRQGAAGPGQARPAHHQRGPRRHRRRGGARRAVREGIVGRRRARRLRHRADDRVAAVRAATRSWSRPTSGPAPGRRRTRPATPSPRWCSWPSPASSCPSP